MKTAVFNQHIRWNVQVSDPMNNKKVFQSKANHPLDNRLEVPQVNKFVLVLARGVRGSPCGRVGVSTNEQVLACLMENPPAWTAIQTDRQNCKNDLPANYVLQVIVALSEKSRQHIPYRNSMMTSMLRDSLGGNCMTTMIATCSVEKKNIDVSNCDYKWSVAIC